MSPFVSLLAGGSSKKESAVLPVVGGPELPAGSLTPVDRLVEKCCGKTGKGSMSPACAPGGLRLPARRLRGRERPAALFSNRITCSPSAPFVPFSAWCSVEIPKVLLTFGAPAAARLRLPERGNLPEGGDRAECDP